MEAYRAEPLVEQQWCEEAIRYKSKLRKREIKFADGGEELPCPRARQPKLGQRHRK